MPELKPIRATKAGMSQCLDGALAGKFKAGEDFFAQIILVLYYLRKKKIAGAKRRLLQVGPVDR